MKMSESLRCKCNGEQDAGRAGGVFMGGKSVKEVGYDGFEMSVEDSLKWSVEDLV